jgi:hypothetical protein
MALTFVKRVAVAVRGKVGTYSVVVNKSGQILLSSLCSKFLNGAKGVFMAFDGGKVYLVRPDAKLVAKEDPKYIRPVRYSKKSGAAAITAGGTLDEAKDFGASHVYDYRKSGNQTFNVTADEKNGCLIFELPATALTPKPVKTRVKKVKVAATKAEPTENVGVPVTEDELVLETA